MKKTFLFLLLLTLSTFSNAQQTFHDFTVISITGDTLPLSQYYGKKVLVVNTASYCGYTYQFGLLQALDSTYANSNFEVVGFPCNDFSGQDPYADSTIATFCSQNYGVTFQMMHKISIRAIDTVDVYKWLQRQDLNGVADAPVSWNFNKYCIDEAGHWVRHFESTVAPFDTAITNWIQSASVLGIADQQKKQSAIKCNLLNGSLQIRFENSANAEATVDLFSVTGSHIATIYAGKLKSDVLNYPVATLNSGIYIVKALIGNKLTSEKIVIQH